MTIVLWILIILLFILSFVGLVVPIIPSILVLWGGFLIYAFGIDRGELSIFFWVGAVLLTVFILVSDLLANQYFVKKQGGSKQGEFMAAIGLFIGVFIYPPFGVIIVPIVLVFLTELFLRKNVKHAMMVAAASLIAFLSSTVAKFIVQLLLIIWFVVETTLL